jgi:hypothetical protein
MPFFPFPFILSFLELKNVTKLPPWMRVVKYNSYNLYARMRVIIFCLKGEKERKKKKKEQGCIPNQL